MCEHTADVLEQPYGPAVLEDGAVLRLEDVGEVYRGAGGVAGQRPGGNRAGGPVRLAGGVAAPHRRRPAPGRGGDEHVRDSPPGLVLGDRGGDLPGGDLAGGSAGGDAGEAQGSVISGQWSVVSDRWSGIRDGPSDSPAAPQAIFSS